MDTAEGLLREGSLVASLEALESDILRRPVDVRLRVFYVQTLMLAGQWDRALEELEGFDAIGAFDRRMLVIAHTYRGLIHSERMRAAVFAGESSPGVIGKAPSWLAQLATCLSLERQGHAAQAAELRADVFDVAPESGGSLNGSAFVSIADADSRLGPVLEVIVGGAYYWAPFACIKHVTIKGPRYAHDLAWLPARFLWRNGDRSTGFVPVRYPGSERSDNDAIRLGRKTDWQPVGQELHTGLGQRLLRINTEKVSILDVRDLSLASCANAAPALAADRCGA